MMKTIITSRCSLTEPFICPIEFAHKKNAQDQEETTKGNIIELLPQNVILSKIKERCSYFTYHKLIINFVRSQL